MTTDNTADLVAEAKAKVERLDGFTPGPWRVVIDDDGNPLSGRPSVSASDELDCGIVHWDGFVQEYWRSARGDKEIHSNAQLIAAAPDMHRTIRDLLAVIEKQGKALRFYADHSHWVADEADWDELMNLPHDLSENEWEEKLADLNVISAIEADNGKCARAALGEKP